MNKNKVLILIAVIIILGAVIGGLYFEGEPTEEEPDEQADIVVEEFACNGEGESVTLEMDDESIISGTVTNKGETEGEIEMIITEDGESIGGPHEWTYTVEPEETKEITEEYERHQTWYPGEFMIEMGEEEIEVEVVE